MSMKRIALSLTATTILVAATAPLMGCASGTLVLTDGRQESREAGDAYQRVADNYRRAGAPEAAKPAQKLADARHSDANKKYESALEWLVDLLLHSWLYSGK
jgi:hypothetical protein